MSVGVFRAVLSSRCRLWCSGDGFTACRIRARGAADGAALKAQGDHNYSIFHDPVTDVLFGYAEIEDEGRWQAIARTDVCRRWWAHMRDIMPANPDNSPVARDVREVFHLD